MAHLEIQIATIPLLKALQEIILPRLYTQCFILPVPGIILDHLEIGIPGQPELKQSGTLDGLTMKIPISIFLVKVSDVIAARGGPAASIGKPKVTGNFLLTVSGTTFDVSFDSILHDSDYFFLFNTIQLQIGIARTTELFSKWEADIKRDVGSKPILTYPIVEVLPPEFTNVSFGRSAISTDATRIAIRLEIDGSGSDGDWSTFLNGTLDDHLNGNDWGLFISADAVTQIVDNQIKALAATFGGVESAPSVWAPQGQQSIVTSVITASFHVDIEALGITVFEGDVPVVASFITRFTLAPFTLVNPQHLMEGVLRTDITFTHKISGGFIADVINDIDDIFKLGGSVSTPPGFTKAGDSELFKDTPIPTQVLGGVLTLTATSVTGNTNGMVITGTARMAMGRAMPECNVLSEHFVLRYITACSAIRDRNQPPPTADFVNAMATFSITESSSPNQIELQCGVLVPIGSTLANSSPNPPDPTLQFLPFLPQLPQQAASSFNFVVNVPVSKMHPNYLDNPYPCEFIVLTSGGARYVSLGELPKPLIDRRDGHVTNVELIYIQDCEFKELTPWTMVMAILDPHWLIDPGPEGRVEREQIVERVLIQTLAGLPSSGVVPIVVNGTQIGTVATGIVQPGQLVGARLTGIASPAIELATTLGRQAALLQRPSLADVSVPISEQITLANRQFGLYKEQYTGYEGKNNE